MSNTKEIWPIDGHAHHNVSREAIYTNAQVNSFLDSDRATVLIASKGMGKTLLLRTKKKLLEDSHGGALIIPRNQEYDEPTLHPAIPDWYKGYEDSEFWQDIWFAAIVLSVLSHVDIERDDANRAIESLDENTTLVHIFRTHVKTSLTHRLQKTPSFFVGELLNIGITAFERLRRSMHIVKDLCTQFISSSANIFIDAFDQALTKRFSSNLTIWRQAQLGLLLAIHETNTANSHVKVYASVRHEAFADFIHEHREVIKGRAVTLEYTERDLHMMFLKGVKQYSEHERIEDFLGVTSVPNAFYKVEEKPFEYIYRHSSGTPRSVMYFGRQMAHARLQEMDDTQRLDAIREQVNRISTEHIFSDYLRGQRKIFLDTLNTDSAVRELLSRLPSNILNMASMHAIRRELATVLEVSEEDCHPFCELFNIGLLGTVSRNLTDPSKQVQRFRKPFEFRWEHEDILSTGSDFFLHPGLHSQILDRNEDYKINPSVLIGDGLPCHAYTHDQAFPLLFISHSRDDKPDVERILDYCNHHLALRLPHDVWYDSWSIRIGSSIAQEIEKGVDRSDLVLLCVSRQSLKSGWVEQEWKMKIYEEIDKDRVCIMGILLDDLSSQDLPLFLRDKLFLRIPSSESESSYIQAVQRLVRDIHSELASRSPMAPPSIVGNP